MFDAALASAVHRAEDHHGHIRQIEIVTDLFEGHYEAVTTVAEAFDGALLGLGVAEAVDGYGKLEKLADSMKHIVPGHDPLVMQRYPAASKALEGIAVRLDADPTC